MAIQKIFRSSLPSFKYFYKNGIAAIFVSGRYTTEQKDLEDELMEEVGAIGRSKSKNPFIYVDENEPELDTEALTPLELLKLQAKEEARAELLAEMAQEHARALNAAANVSTSSASHASSVNTTAMLNASMGTEASLQALPVTEAAGEDKAAAPAPGSMAARLATLIPKKA